MTCEPDELFISSAAQSFLDQNLKYRASLKDGAEKLMVEEIPREFLTSVTSKVSTYTPRALRNILGIDSISDKTSPEERKIYVDAAIKVILKAITEKIQS